MSGAEVKKIGKMLYDSGALLEGHFFTQGHMRILFNVPVSAISLVCCFCGKNWLN